MNYIPPFKLLFCCIFLLAVPIVLGEGQPKGNSQKAGGTVHPIASSDAANEEVLAELKRIRRKLGGSVLQGSLLDNSVLPIDEESDSGMRKVLGLPEAIQPDGHMTSHQVVKSLRVHCTRIDLIANEIESLRQYDNADQLRDTARQLRLIARQFDGHPKDARK